MRGFPLRSLKLHSSLRLMPKPIIMKPRPLKRSAKLPTLSKTPTGIVGLDQITGGGLPTGRPTLVCGSAGCGKTLLSMQFLVNGILHYGEPGVFMAFEETSEDLARNMASLQIDLRGMIAAKRLALVHVRLERSEIEEAGDFDLGGFFVRLELAINAVKAKRVVLDTVETLFGGLPNANIVRAELGRLFRWLKEKGMTAIITGEQGEKTLTRFGIEEYVSDCVIRLDHQIDNQICTRRLRVVKYRGSMHGTNDYPFLVDNTGISIAPITSLQLNHEATARRISSGVPRLDTMLGGKGYFRGSSILVSGTAGSGKTSLAVQFADAACSRGEKCLHFLLEESPSQLVRNMRSIGIRLQPWIDKGLLRLIAARPTRYGLEMHLVSLLKESNDFAPANVVLDPLTSFLGLGSQADTKATFTRLIDFTKSRGITTMLINLSHPTTIEQSESEISSLVDTWIHLRDMESDGERNRGLYILKSRGMNHSNQIREFRLTHKGIQLIDVYTGVNEVLVGSARIAQQAREEVLRIQARNEAEQHKLALESKRKVLQNTIAALQADFRREETALRRLIEQHKAREKQAIADQNRLRRSRHADRTPPTPV